MPRLFYIILCLCALALMWLPGCREIPTDRTYALWLDREPNEAD